MTADQSPPRTVLITGAAKRIGRAIALGLAQAGWQIGVHYNRSKDAADTLVGEITDQGGRAGAMQADLASWSDTSGLVPACSDMLGPVSCLINNASIFERDEIESISEASWEKHIAINLRAPVQLAQAFAAALPKDMDGNIISILDQRVWNLTPKFFSYTVSKSALWTATQTLAQALAPRIRVNAIGPGPTLPSPRQSKEMFDRQQHAVPLERGASPDEIASAVRFVLDAPAMTGQMIALDGGQHLAWETPDVTGSDE
jgi:NAD(P)-dependent dehydrogenase (short-subunit alcohol dehydrogenase family)